MKPNRRRLHEGDGAIRHLKTRESLAKAWTKLARDIYTPRVCKGTPHFVRQLAETFWRADPSNVISAITKGDPAYFVAFQIRLDQIDNALLACGRGIAERAPVIRARFVIEGLQNSAAKVLAENGGTWPPEPAATDDPPEESPG